MRTTRPVALAALAVTASLVLSGCTPPNPADSEQLNVQESLKEQNAPASIPPVSDTTKQGTSTMKTISDFELIEANQATITTSKGDIVIKLYRNEAPLTTLNFLSLAKSGFYDGIVFHRVIADFMAQVGDPLTKEADKQAMWGTGGPGYTIADEFGPGLKHDGPGVVSMANAGPNTGGSQFFITYEATPWLDGKHAVFGKVTEGIDVLKKITVGDTIKSIKLETATE